MYFLKHFLNDPLCHSKHANSVSGHSFHLTYFGLSLAFLAEKASDHSKQYSPFDDHLLLDFLVQHSV